MLQDLESLETLDMNSPKAMFLDVATIYRLPGIKQIAEYVQTTLTAQEAYMQAYRDRTEIKMKEGVIIVETKMYPLGHFATCVTSPKTGAEVATYQNTNDAQMGHKRVCELVPQHGSDLKAYLTVKIQKS